MGFQCSTTIAYATFAYIGQSMFFSGGKYGQGAYSSSVEGLSHNNELSWVSSSVLAVPRSYMVGLSNLNQALLYYLGGTGALGVVSLIEKVSPYNGTGNTLSLSLSTPLTEAASVDFGSQYGYAMGGATSAAGTLTSRMDKFTFGTELLATASATLEAPTRLNAAAVVGNNVIVAGGCGATDTPVYDSVRVVVAATGQEYATSLRLSVARSSLTAMERGGIVASAYFAGGLASTGQTYFIEKIDRYFAASVVAMPLTNSWHGLTSASVTSVARGYLAGGQKGPVEGNLSSAIVECCSLSTETFRITSASLSKGLMGMVGCF